MVIGVREVGQPPGVPTEHVSAAGMVMTAGLPVPLRAQVDLFGVRIDQVNLHTALDRICGFLEAGTPHQIVTVNLDFLHLAEQDPLFRATINEADLAVPDGMPLVWLSHILGTPLACRVTGVDLVNESCRLAAEAGIGVFLLGGRPEVSAIAAARARERFPGLHVTPYAPPLGPISPQENQRIVDMIHEAQPGFLFVALGAPRQDLWIREHRDVLGVPVMMGVGCVIDLLAGTVRRAPEWMRASGLEWSYRLIQEPRRLWRRYLLDDFPLFGRLAWLALQRGSLAWTPAITPQRETAE